MSIQARMQRRFTLYKNRERTVRETAGYNWRATHHNRMEIINRAVGHMGVEGARYLEIGCQSDVCFNAIMAAHKVGVDPNSGGTIRATSDEFFRSNTETFDVIFVDGYHEFAQARRDVMNGLGCLRTGGLIFCHDMLPNTWVEELPLPLGGFFCGDIWKMGHELAGTAGITYRTIVADFGVGVIRKDTDSPQYNDRYQDLAGRDFRYYLDHRDRMLPIDFNEYVRLFLPIDRRASASA